MPVFSSFSSFFSTPAAPSTQPTEEKRILEEPAIKAPSSIPSQQSAVAPPLTREEKPSLTADRSNRNKIVFGAGLGFFAFSLLITRRSLARRRLASQAAFYSDAPSHHVEQSRKVSGAMEAIEALNIATVNVLSVSMMAVGGTLWYLDINSMEEARRMLRGGLGVDGTGRSEKEAEEDFEEWMATTLSRKEAKEKQRQVNK